MSTLKTTNLQNADASSANIVLGQGSGGGATISGVTTTTTLQTADSIIHTGDTDTKIRFPSADTVTVETGGSERIRIDSSGRLLLGTTTEGAADADDFTIASSSTTAGITIRTSTSGTGRLWFSDGTSGAAEYQGYVQYDHNTSKLIIGSGGGDKVIVDANGNTNITGITTATHFIPTAQPYGTKNLVINGSMLVAQRGTSSTTNGYGSLDRWNVTMGNTDEAFTHSQIELSSSDTGPWAEGFHNAMRIQNGNQTSGWQANSHGVLHQFIEDRDIAQSGWQIESPSSYITVSYWIRSSVAQAFGGHIETYDGTDKTWIWSTGTLSANTWTKITKTIGGDSALSMSNDIGRGLQIQPWFIWGTTYTASDATLNGWASYNGGKRFTDMTSTWWTTNDATVDITGVQIEVGKAATPFEHRSYADELLRSQRYYQQLGSTDTNLGGDYTMLPGYTYHNGLRIATSYVSNVKMRTTPTIAEIGNGIAVYGQGTNAQVATIFNINTATDTNVIIFAVDGESSKDWGAIDHAMALTNNTGGGMSFSAEL